MATPALAEQERVAAEQFHAAGLPARELLAAAHVGARLVADPVGSSQLGGRPRMPADWSWPEWKGRPLQYLARIDLRELSSVLSEDGRHGLPASGQLHLMADALAEGWGFDPAHRGSFSALIVGPEQVTVDHATPPDIDDEGYRIELELPVRPVRPAVELVLPDPIEDEVRALLDDAQFDAYAWQVRDEIDDQLFDGAPHHRLFGRPDVVQNPMELECQLASNGVYVGGPQGYASPEAAKLAPGAADWCLLAQIDSDDELGLMWGDVGRIYWWVRHEDAAMGRVDRCWGILQCG